MGINVAEALAGVGTRESSMNPSAEKTLEARPPAWQLIQPRISAAEAVMIVPDGWRRFTLVRAVPAGEALARRIRPQGEGDDLVGEGLTINQQGFLVAKKTGAAMIDHMGRLQLGEVHRFPGLEDRPKTIVLTGSAVIDGPVGPGWCIRATGDVEIRGYVSDATIVADGSVLVRGDVTGSSSSSMIVAGWDVIVNQAADTEILAGHDVAAGHQLLNCNVTADGRIFVGQPPTRSGIISGGRTHAGREIVLFRSGSPGVFPPELVLGPMPGMGSSLKGEAQEIADLQREIPANLRRYETADTTSHLTLLRQTYRSLWSLHLKERAAERLSDGLPDAERVAVFGLISAGSQVTIRDKRTTVGHEINEAKQFVLRGDAVVAEAAVPLEKPAPLRGAPAAASATPPAAASNGRLPITLPPTLIHELDLVKLFTGGTGATSKDVWAQVQRLEGELRAAEARGSIRRLLIRDPQTGTPHGYAYRRDDVKTIAAAVGISI
jgi:hypothetical protein